MVKALREKHPQVTFAMTQPLGIDVKLVELLEKRIDEAQMM